MSNRQQENDQTPTEELKPFKGMIAYFDILGYKQIAQSGITKNILTVLHILKTAKCIVKAELQALHLQPFFKVDYFAQVMQSILDSIETENISDSLVSTINLESCLNLDLCNSQKEHIDSTWIPVYIFILYCNRLNGLLFKEGLPVRGAIAHGDIFKQDRVLAGKPLIDAYSLSESLNCACVVLSISTESWLKNLPCSYPDLIWQYFCLFDVELKSNHSELQCLTNPGLFENKKSIQDVRNFVCEAFAGQGKTVAAEVLIKLENTIALLNKESSLVSKRKESFNHLYQR